MEKAKASTPDLISLDISMLRPFPIGGFERMPFGMGREEIRQCLDRMAGLGAYQDIAQTTTSAGNTFLYSRTFLDPEYAAALAEWIDVGQYDNP
jgi:hypothetical protein